jgi:hypothetical protein
MSIVSPPFAIPNTIPVSADINAKINDIATEISDSLSRSGKGGMLQPLKMGGFKVVQIGDGVAPSDAVNLGQLQSSTIPFASSITGTGDEIVATFIPTLNPLAANREFRFTAIAANTSMDGEDPIEPTIEIDGGTPLVIKKANGTSLLPGDIAGPGYICACVFNGTDVVLLNPAIPQEQVQGEYLGINTQTGLSYNFNETDKGWLVVGDNVSDMVFTILPEDEQDLPVNTRIDIWQKNDGQIMVTPGSDVTLRAKDDKHLTAARNSVAHLVKIGPNDWLLYGDLTNASPPLGGAPTIVDVTASEGAAANTVQAITLPASMLSGQLLIAGVATTNQGTVTWPAGWTELSDQADILGSGFATAWHRCDGTEPATINVTLSAASPSTQLVVRINNAHTATPPEAGTPPASSSINNPNPPSLTPTWGAANTLWLAFGKTRTAAATVTSYPATYTLNQTLKAHSGGTATDTAVAVAGRQLNAVTEDPAAYAFSAVAVAQAQTIAIPPISGSVPPGPSGGYPALVLESHNLNTSATSNHSVNLPSGITAGELLIGVICAPQGNSFVWPAGWTRFQDQNEGGNLDLSIAWKLATGSETSPITVTSGGSQTSIAWCGRFTNALTTAAPNVAQGRNTSGQPNPPSLTKTGASEKVLWFTFVTRNLSAAPTTYPANYTLHNLHVPGTAAHGLSMAARELQAVTEDPGAYAYPTTSRWVAFTVGIRPKP